MRKSKIALLASSAMLCTILSCQSNKAMDDKSPSGSLLDSTLFNDTINGKKVGLYHIENKNHMSADFTNCGGRIINLLVPDKDGKMIDVVAGFSSLKGFQDSKGPFGATIGRYGNRIAKGTFSIDGTTYHSPTNNGPNMLHGGPMGFQNVVFDVEKLNESTLQFTYLSVDGEMGFPGNLKVKVIYQLTDDNALKITYDAATDKKTVVNLTNHAFFNLNGEASGTILNHQLQFFAKTFTPVDSTLIPTGELRAVKNTPFDFSELTQIGKRINEADEQLKNGKGYDHNFVLNGTEKGKHAAKVIGDKSGVVMDIYTDEPGIQFYSGNFMKGQNTFKSGVKDDYRTAFCLETQHFPNSPNQANFPSTLLSPSQTYHTVSEYKFSVVKK